MRATRFALLALVPAALSLPAHGQLNVALNQAIDISGLGFNNVGGAAFDDQRGTLFLCDAAGQDDPFGTIGNNLVVPVATRQVYSIPRRSNGPLISPLGPGPVPGTFSAFSVQSIGFGPTRDQEGICGFNRAQNLAEFKQALQLLDFASQHITYADKRGNIAYFLSGEVPLREDLLNPSGSIRPPYLVRSGFEVIIIADHLLALTPCPHPFVRLAQTGLTIAQMG